MASREKDLMAVDFDDVCVGYGSGFTKFSNQAGWTHGMKPTDYTENWCDLWQIDDSDEIARRTEMMNRGMNPFLRPIRGSQMALSALAKKYDLMILTSRPKHIHEVTKATADKYFPGVFKDLRYLEGGWGKYGATTKSKGETAVEMGASVLIDDQPRHAVGMAMAGGVGLLFGENQLAVNTESEVPGVVKVSSWPSVLEQVGIDSKSVFPKNQ